MLVTSVRVSAGQKYAKGTVVVKGETSKGLDWVELPCDAKVTNVSVKKDDVLQKGDEIIRYKRVYTEVRKDNADKAKGS